MDNTIKKAVRFAAVLCLWLAGGCLLHRYEYFSAFAAIDNLIGMLPFALVLFGVGSISAIFFIKHHKENLPLLAALYLLTALSAALFPTALRGDWWLNSIAADQTEAAPDLTQYAPFAANSQTAKLSGAATLRLSGKLPVLDGAIALYPLYAAFAEAVYDESAFTKSSVLCTNTRSAYDAVIAGERDIIFVARASQQQLAAAKAAGAELTFTPIGREAFVFLVGKRNPVNNITYQQIRNIYSGKTAEWHTLGWHEGGRIVAFQRPEGSGSQTGLQKLMGSLPIQAPQPLPDPSLLSTNSLLKQVSAEWQGVQPALGYSYRFFATAMYANPDAKLLQVDGVAPSSQNIRDNTYPFVADFYAVTKGEPTGSAKELLEWILSPQGQEIIAKTGYTPLGTR